MWLLTSYFSEIFCVDPLISKFFIPWLADQLIFAILAELLEKWPYFGTTFFFVGNAIDGEQRTGECLLAISKHGIKVISLKDREELMEIALPQVHNASQWRVSF